MSLTANLVAPKPQSRREKEVEKQEFTILPLGLTFIVFEGAEGKVFFWRYGGKIYLEEDICNLLAEEFIMATGQVRHHVSHVKAQEFHVCMKEALRNHHHLAEL